MGVVFQAHDPHLERLVALKAMLPELATNPSAKQRFLREARAAAAIKHDHIVTIYQVGEDGDAPFLAMEFLEGESLDDRLKREGRLPVHEIWRIGREMADGLAAAHKRGLIHRDVKPGNVWLEGEGGRVKILDFGLARAAGDAAEEARPDSSTLRPGDAPLVPGEPPTALTQQGAVVGTPGYMAPEQADGRPVDARGDLFSLGCVLYRMATGEPPFKGDDLLSMLRAVSTATPTPPRELNPSLPPSLCDLIRSLLAKKAEDRPPSARAVVEAIQAIEREEASSRTEIQVAASALPAAPRRPPTPAAGVSRRTWLPVAAVVLLGTLAYAAYLFGPAIVRYTSDEGELVIEIDDPRVQAVIDQTGATIHDKATGREYRVKPGRRDVKPLKAGDYEIEVTEVGGDMRLFTKEFTITRGGATPVRVVFDAATLAKKPIAVDPAASAEKPVTEATNRELRRFEGHGDLIRTVVFSPDGRYLLSGSGGEYRAGQWLPGSDYTLRLWDVQTGKEVRKFVGHTGWVTGVAFSPDGRRAVSGSWDRTVRLWDVKTGKELHKFEGHTDEVNGVAFSPDGKRALSGSLDHTMRLWDVETGKEVRKFEGHSEWVHAVAFSPDGKRALSGGGGLNQNGQWVHGTDQTVRLWDVETGRELKRLEGNTNWVDAVAFLPDGRRALSASLDRTLRLWDLDTGKELRRFLGHAAGVIAVAVSPDGRFALSGAEDQTARLWDLESGKELQRFEGHTGNVLSVAFSPDGRLAATAGTDRTIRLWRLFDPTAPAKAAVLYAIPWQDEQQHFPAHITQTRFSPDGRLFFGAGDSGPSGAVRVWNAVTGKQIQEFVPGGDVWFSSAQFLPGGKYLVTSYSSDNDLYLWEIATGKVVRKFVGHTKPLLSFTVSPDGKRILSWDDDQTMRLWDVETGEELRKLEGHPDKASGAFSPDGKQILTFGPDQTLRLWDVETGKELRELGGRVTGGAGCFSPDGKQVLSYGPSKTIRLLDLETGNVVRRFEGSKAGVDFAGFVAGGRLVVGRSDEHSDDKKLRVWETASGKLVSEINCARFGPNGWTITASPDGRLALVNADGVSVRVLDLATGQEIHRYNGCREAKAFSFSPDGTLAVAGSFRAGMFVFQLPSDKAGGAGQESGK